MSRTKLSTALVVVLALGLLGAGAGVASVYLWAAGPPQGQAPNPKAEVGQAGRLQELLKRRRDVAREELRLRNKEWQQGRLADSNLLFDVALRLLDAELALSTGRAARTAACKAHLAHMKEFEAIARSRFEAARLSAAGLVMAQYYVLDAEIRLERAKTEEPAQPAASLGSPRDNPLAGPPTHRVHWGFGQRGGRRGRPRAARGIRPLRTTGHAFPRCIALPARRRLCGE